jgi:hypothetical protein
MAGHPYSRCLDISGSVNARRALMGRHGGALGREGSAARVPTASLCLSPLEGGQIAHASHRLFVLYRFFPFRVPVALMEADSAAGKRLALPSRRVFAIAKSP